MTENLGKTEALKRRICFFFPGQRKTLQMGSRGSFEGLEPVKSVIEIVYQSSSNHDCRVKKKKKGKRRE